MGDFPKTQPLPHHSFVRFDGSKAGASPTVFRFRATVEAGPDAGTSQWVGPRCVVGTHETADFRLTDTTVSRFHLELSAGLEGVRGVDLGSFNGTFCDGARIRELVVPRAARVKLGATVLRVAREAESASQQEGPDAYGPLLGRAPVMRQLFALLQRIERNEANVLVEGESGTGKELLCRALHTRSGRPGPFVVVDCAALGGELAESELFGHVEGAFTGASEGRPGAFASADRGTVFLDEIGELAPALQPKLLRVLETRRIRPVGGDVERAVDVRILASSQHALDRRVATGALRSDLFFRLAVMFFTLPPLRERREDIPLLAQHFADAEAGRPVELPRAELAHWARQPWPGNGRELRNAVVRWWSERAGAGPTRSPVPEPPQALKEAREAFTRQYLEALLRRHHGQVAPAAAEAGLGRTYLYALLRRMGLLKE